MNNMNHLRLSQFTNSDEGSWSAVSDIGKIYNSKLFTQNEYMRVENLYINAIHNVLDVVGCGNFRISMYEDKRGYENVEARIFNIDDPYVKIRGGEYISNHLLYTLCRLCLRELMWLRLESDNGCYITFGYDFCVRMGIPENMEVLSVIPDGIFLNKMDDDPHE
ncbi:hypothetical protein TUM4438_46180 [Shewanella sairae]|uniref:Uncharacterized protein n=1 Tax=Shewanella sairae TaxID=190310 RepID=A0ABQ4PS04_9GAMM|nr:hypothetical protein [Shewanella sairae]MCL1132683.1 hypothetical protein [Shewanella sairae]GIU52753.1 hypothetical protein TUM4438_46180 [Shewanella sairae]